MLAAQHRGDEVGRDVAASVEAVAQRVEQPLGAAVGSKELGGEVEQRELDILQRPGELAKVRAHQRRMLLAEHPAHGLRVA